MNRDAAAGLQRAEGFRQDLIELPRSDRGVERPFEHHFVEARIVVRDATWQRDSLLTRSMYRCTPVLLKDTGADPWSVSFLRMLDMANDSGLFKTSKELLSEGWRPESNCFRKGEDLYVPLYEAKMFFFFNHRHGDYGLLSSGEKGHVLPNPSEQQLQDARYRTVSRYWVPDAAVGDRLRDRWNYKWLLAWRDVTDSRASARTAIWAILPRVGVGHKAPLLLPGVSPIEISCWYASLSSFALDYASRQKVGGTTMAIFILKQLPVLTPETYAQPCPWEPAVTLAEWIKPRVLELTYTAWDMKPFAEDLVYTGEPFIWNEARRAELRADLDAAFFHLYGISEADADYILETFPIVKSKDVEKHGTYRTKEMILERYRAMAAHSTAVSQSPPAADRITEARHASRPRASKN